MQLPPVALHRNLGKSMVVLTCTIVVAHTAAAMMPTAHRSCRRRARQLQDSAYVAMRFSAQLAHQMLFLLT